MPTRHEVDMFFYHGPTHTEKEIDGVMHYRNKTMPLGMWKPLPSAIDRLLDHVLVVTKTKNQTVLLERIGLLRFGVSRYRNGKYTTFPLEWLVKLSMYSTIPLKQICLIAGIEPMIKSYQDYEDA